MTDTRASSLRPGDTYAEMGMDETTVRTIDHHGDRVLVTTTDGVETSHDTDEVVELVHRPDVSATAHREIVVTVHETIVQRVRVTVPVDFDPSDPDDFGCTLEAAYLAAVENPANVLDLSVTSRDIDD
jgi:hypothetical protein